jgi:hypothetical protein
MTSDEALAEKYADTVKCEWENETYWVDCRDKITDAFIAGLKAGKPKWHNFRENRNDIPPLKEGCDRASIKVVDEAGRCITYDHGSKCWRSYTGDRLGVQPDFWCEIPMYSEEQE